MDGPLVAIFRYFTSCAIGCLRLDELSMPLWVSNRELDWPVCFCRFHKPRFLTINVSTHNSKSTIFWLWKAKHIKATTPQKWVWTNLFDTIRLAAAQRIFIPIQIAAALVSIFDIGEPWWGNWLRPCWNFFGQGENTWKKETRTLVFAFL